jgi:hypothetical protein
MGQTLETATVSAYADEFARGWSGGPGVCGGGSNDVHASRDRARLDEVMEQWRTIYGREPIVLEVGCGDLHWHGERLPERYHGIDLHARPSWSEWDNLVEGNAADAALSRADIAVARQVFIHLSNRVILSILDNLRQHGIPWLLASTVDVGKNDPRLAQDQDYSLRGHSVDLTAAPFYLAPVEMADNNSKFRLFKIGDN